MFNEACGQGSTLEFILWDSFALEFGPWSQVAAFVFASAFSHFESLPWAHSRVKLYNGLYVAFFFNAPKGGPS